MRHPNKVLTREDILNHIWDFAFDSFSNVVDVHIKNLRKKIEDNPKSPKYVITVMKLGYKFGGDLSCKV